MAVGIEWQTTCHSLEHDSFIETITVRDLQVGNSRSGKYICNLCMSTYKYPGRAKLLLEHQTLPLAPKVFWSAELSK